MINFATITITKSRKHETYSFKAIRLLLPVMGATCESNPECDPIQIRGITMTFEKLHELNTLAGKIKKLHDLRDNFATVGEYEDAAGRTTQVSVGKDGCKVILKIGDTEREVEGSNYLSAILAELDSEISSLEREFKYYI